jgi:hypothetical protein
MRKRTYFTFGQNHAHRHGNITLDKDIVVCTAVQKPRELMFERFGAKWSFEYSKLPDMSYFPRGVYDLDESKLLERSEYELR